VAGFAELRPGALSGPRAARDGTRLVFVWKLVQVNEEGVRGTGISKATSGKRNSFCISVV
jgi:hypothetical protein